MRIQCNLLPFFFLGIVVTSMVEASRGKGNNKKNGKKRKKQPSPLPSILDDDWAVAEHEVLVSQVLTGQSGKGEHDDNDSISKTPDSSSFLSLNSLSAKRDGSPSVLSQVSATSDLPPSVLHPPISNWSHEKERTGKSTLMTSILHHPLSHPWLLIVSGI